MGCGVRRNQLEHTVFELLIASPRSNRRVVRKVDDGFDLLPANGDLVAAEVWLMEKDHLDGRLREILAPVRDAYDFIVIDCPPSLNILTINALTAADGLVIPLQCEYYALEGLSALVETIEAIRSSNSNPNLKSRDLRTMYDSRNS